MAQQNVPINAPLVLQGASQDDALQVQESGDAFPRVKITAAGKVLTGSGAAPPSTDITNGGFQNPMSTQGDLIQGGAIPAGTPTRLGIGSSTQLLGAGAIGPSLAWRNLNTQDIVNALGGLSPASYSKGTTGQSIPASADTAITYDTNVSNPLGAWSGTHTTRFTAPATGTYRILANTILNVTPARSLPTFVSVADSAGLATNSKSVSIPTGTQAGDVLVFFVQGNGSGAPTAPGGLTLQISNNGGSAASVWTYTYTCTGSDPGSFNFTFTTAVQSCLKCIAYRGVTAVDRVGSAIASAASIAPPSVTTLFPNELCVVGYAFNGGASTDTLPGGITRRGANNNSSNATQDGGDFTQTTAGATSSGLTATCSGATSAQAQVITLVGATSGSSSFTYLLEYRVNGTGAWTTIGQQVVASNVTSVQIDGEAAISLNSGDYIEYGINQNTGSASTLSTTLNQGSLWRLT